MWAFLSPHLLSFLKSGRWDENQHKERPLFFLAEVKSILKKEEKKKMIHYYFKLRFGSCSKYQESWEEEQLTDSFENGCMFLGNHILAPGSQICLGLHTLWIQGELVIWITFGCLATVFLKSLFLRWRYYMRLSKGKICFCKLQSGMENTEDVLKKQNKAEK